MGDTSDEISCHSRTISATAWDNSLLFLTDIAKQRTNYVFTRHGMTESPKQ